VVVGDRLRALREAKNLSQLEIEERTGLLRSYVAGVENGETVPTVETLENIACALEVPLYELFYDSEEPPALENLPNRLSTEDIAWGGSGRAIGLLRLFSPAAPRSHWRATPARASRTDSKGGAREIGRSRAKLTSKGVQGMGDRAYNGLDGSAIRQDISFHRNWAAGGGAMDLHCPHCKSTDLKNVSLAYQEGLFRVDTRTRLSGVLIGSGGPDMVVGRARTEGVRQTELSKRLSPPGKWSYLKLVTWGGIISILALIAYVNHVMVSAPPVSVLPVEIYVVLFLGAMIVLSSVFWKHNHSTYARRLAQWNGSFICQRCGNVSQRSFSGNLVSGIVKG
jgi:transcriptional regulator with XRE-family HTH domain